ncbi:MAG: integrase arm-type DNA-binding domain-containing protein [Pseudomonadota bacterium]
MPRSETLTALRVRAIEESGRYLDKGRKNGLSLQVQKGKTGGLSKGWIVRFSVDGRRREMGLGPYPDVSLSEARERAADIRHQIAKGLDPISEKRAERALQKAAVTTSHAETARSKSDQSAATLDPETFRGCAEAYISAQSAGWANPKHKQQWTNTLRTYAYPVLGDLKVKDVTLDHVLQVIEPIWTKKTETASRVRGRIEAVLNYGIARGYREPPNPATWRGQLQVLLPPKNRIAPVKHHEALPYRELPAFMAELSRRRAPAALTLAFTILTAARSAEVREMVWDEVDFESRTWIVPAERMKARAEHRVPLSEAALSILVGQRAAALHSFWVFPNASGQKPFSDAVYRALFARMGRPTLTAHGFRSTFRDWCGEETSYPRELAEHSLAHQVGSAVELAYRRGDALERRRKLMEEWGRFAMAEV